MARTIAEIKAVITKAFIEDVDVIAKYELETGKTFDQQFSKVSLENILFFTIAAVIWTHEQIFDTYKAEVQEIINQMQPHSAKWYRNLALAFRYKYALIPDSDKFEQTAIDDEAAAIIKYASVTRKENILVMKVAKEVSGGLAALTNGSEDSKDDEFKAFSEYIYRTMDAGVNIRIISQEADYLRLTLDIYYDPLVLDELGRMLTGDNDRPVQDAIATYLQTLPFDGDFSLTALTDALQLTTGVSIPRVMGAQYKYGASDWIDITNKYKPDAGWLKIYNEETDLTIYWHADIQD